MVTQLGLELVWSDVIDPEAVYGQVSMAHRISDDIHADLVRHHAVLSGIA